MHECILATFYGCEISLRKKNYIYMRQEKTLIIGLQIVNAIILVKYYRNSIIIFLISKTLAGKKLKIKKSITFKNR